MKKQLFQNYGTVPSDIDNQDYDELMDTLNARPKEERPVDATEAQNKLRSLFS